MPFKIKILMMLKNEDDLLLKWGIFHGNMVGYENLIIFDNGSSSNITLDALHVLERDGAIVVRDKNSRDDFYNKGTVISNYIKECDANDPADFYFPLDCDEFLGTSVADESVASFEIEEISNSLSIHLNSSDILMIGGEYGNFPGHPDMFRFSPTQRKCFFAKGACDTLNRGYHQAKVTLPLLANPD